MRYYVDNNCITHDRLQDEVIVINVVSGTYYSGLGTAADIWSLLTQGASVAEAARKLAEAYSADETTILLDTTRCVAFLTDRGLIQANDKLPPAAALVLPHADRKTWNTPDFEEHTDMWDLIKLDPIHETGEGGWPIAKP